MTIWDTLVGLFAALMPAGPAPGYNGYLEADYIYVAPLTAGRITAIEASEGDRVTAGQVLLRLDDDAQQAAVAGADAAVKQAQANLENLSTGSREAEKEVIEASLRKAQADSDLANANLARTEQLFEQGQVPTARVDQDRSSAASAQAQVEQLSAQLKVAELPARVAEQAAAEAALKVAQAQAASARNALDNRVLAAPAAGVLDRSFYQVGEVAASGAAVMSIYDPAKLKAIFFVPEAARASIAPGMKFAVTCDGCTGVVADVTRLASQPQFTPPILFSRDERGRLVFQVEAQLEASGGLQPGQPVTLEPLK